MGGLLALVVSAAEGSIAWLVKPAMDGIFVKRDLLMLKLIPLAIFPAAGVTVRALGRKLYTINKRTQEKIAELNVVLQESFAGTKIVKAFGRERLEQERFDQVNDRLLRLALKNQRTDQAA